MSLCGGQAGQLTFPHNSINICNSGMYYRKIYIRYSAVVDNGVHLRISGRQPGLRIFLAYSQAKLETGSSEGTTMLEDVGKGEVPGAPEEITVAPIAFPPSTQGRQKPEKM